MTPSQDSLIALIALMIVLAAHTVVIARWSARLDTVVKAIQKELGRITDVVLRHDKDIEQLKISVEVERQVRAYMEMRQNGFERGDKREI
jgi:hypothetical protein